MPSILAPYHFPHATLTTAQHDEIRIEFQILNFVRIKNSIFLRERRIVRGEDKSRHPRVRFIHQSMGGDMDHEYFPAFALNASSVASWRRNS